MVKFNWFYFTGIVAGLLCLGLMAGTHASAANKNPCAKEIAKYCKKVQKDRVALLGCLEQHESELSDACKAYEAKLEGKKGEMREEAKIKMRFQRDCSADIKKFCQNVDPAQEGLVKCVNEHKNDLSTSCSNWIKADKAESTRTK